jgi:hypothetical protein
MWIVSQIKISRCTNGRNFESLGIRRMIERLREEEIRRRPRSDHEMLNGATRSKKKDGEEERETQRTLREGG